jgi:hypothetical protein
MENSVSTDATYLNEDGVARLARLVDYFEMSESATVTARKLSERDRRYYDNFDDSQWTEAEKATLRKRKQPITTLNRIKSKINYLVGVEAQRRSLPKAFQRNPQDEDGANAATDALRYVIEDQRFPRTRTACFKNMAIEGACGVEVSVYQAQDDVKISINQIAWDRMFWDPHSREPDFSDAKYLGQVVWKDLEEARAEYPDAHKVFDATFAAERNSASSSTYEDAPRMTWADAKRKRIRIVGVWHLEEGKWYHCLYTKGGIIKEEPSPFVDEEGNSVPSFIFGSAFIDSEGNRYGAARDWISIQDEINKRRSKSLHQINSRQTKAEKGAVDDVNKMKAELAKPDGHVEINPNMQFEILTTNDQAQGNLELLNQATQAIDSVGVNAAMTGTETRSMSGRALMKREESGLAEMGPLFDGLHQFDLDVYRAVWQRIKQFWTAEKWVRVTDDERNVRFVGLNTPLTLGEKMLEEVARRGQEVTPEMEFEAKNRPELQQVVGLRNNVALLDVDITIDEAPASASIQAEQFEVLADLAKVRPDIPTAALIEASSLRNKEKLLKQMGVDKDPNVMRLEKQMKDMGQAMERMQAELHDKRADRALEARKIDIQAEDSETKRLTAIGGMIDPAMLQALIAQTVTYVLQSPDLLPMRPPQIGMMPQGGPPGPIPPGGLPPMNQPQPQPGPAPGFLLPNQPQPMPPAGALQ